MLLCTDHADENKVHEADMVKAWKLPTSTEVLSVFVLGLQQPPPVDQQLLATELIMDNICKMAMFMLQHLNVNG